MHLFVYGRNTACSTVNSIYIHTIAYVGYWFEIGNHQSMKDLFIFTKLNVNSINLENVKIMKKTGVNR